MKPRLHVSLRLAAALLIIAAVAEAAMVAGGFVYTKSHQTSLLKEPVPMTPKVSRIALGRKLKIEEVRGLWLRVSDGSTTGWIFNGNVSDTKPEEIKDSTDNPLLASETTATAASRGATPETEAYASRRSLTSSLDDLNWMNNACIEISDQDLLLFLQENKKGEYQ